MSSQPRWIRKHLQTHSTFKWFLSRMCPLMHFQSIAVDKPFVADTTPFPTRFGITHSAVSPMNVPPQIFLIFKSLSTKSTNVGRSSMDTLHVDIQQAVAPKLSTALQTLVFGPVHLTDMGIQSLSALKIQQTPSDRISCLSSTTSYTRLPQRS